MLLTDNWKNIGNDTNLLHELEQRAIPEYLKRCRWFSAKSSQLDSVTINEVFSIPVEPHYTHLILLTAYHSDNHSDTFLLPITLANDEEINSKSFISEINILEKRFNVIDAIYSPLFIEVLFNSMVNEDEMLYKEQRISFKRGKGLLPQTVFEKSHTLNLDQSNSSAIINDAYFLKFFRKLFPAINPDYEMVSFLTEETNFKNLPAFAGVITLHNNDVPTTLGLMQTKVSFEKDCWSLCGDYLNDYLFSVQNGQRDISDNGFILTRLLATRTAELHLALASGTNYAFAPENFDQSNYREEQMLRMQRLTIQRSELMEDNLYKLNEYGLTLAKNFKANLSFIQQYFSLLKDKKLHGIRTRIHGDYHLGQILYTGNDVIIIDFEGEPESSIYERRIKHSPLKDVAGILRSFHYAVCSKLFFSIETKGISIETLTAATTYWYNRMKDEFLTTYFSLTDSIYNHAVHAEYNNYLLQMHLLEKAIYELGYELNSRPRWVMIPLKGIEHTLQLIQQKDY
jgi:maltose alpha-D-glucosyltransferase/alpha-amylase